MIEESGSIVISDENTGYKTRPLYNYPISWSAIANKPNNSGSYAQIGWVTMTSSAMTTTYTTIGFKASIVKLNSTMLTKYYYFDVSTGEIVDFTTPESTDRTYKFDPIF